MNRYEHLIETPMGKALSRELGGAWWIRYPILICQDWTPFHTVRGVLKAVKSGVCNVLALPRKRNRLPWTYVLWYRDRTVAVGGQAPRSDFVKKFLE